MHISIVPLPSSFIPLPSYVIHLPSSILRSVRRSPVPCSLLLNSCRRSSSSRFSLFFFSQIFCRYKSAIYNITIGIVHKLLTYLSYCSIPIVLSAFAGLSFAEKTNRVKPDSYNTSYRWPTAACREKQKIPTPFLRMHQERSVYLYTPHPRHGGWMEST